MSVELKYIKRSPGLLKDLQKVFFCSTEEDRIRYFDEVSSDLFELQDNLSVWYIEGDIGQLNEEEKQAHLSDLSQMALFVVPVTGGFLKTENAARELELDFAIKQNIPVLPLLEEQGLEILFNEVCGNLQILNKYDPDPTALPFKDKLKLFLDTVLLKDDMILKIRKAFAAYIFLSYRKKDRRYAQEVMKLIHRDPFTRDIAIWYDEFLTPGEDFNESIKEAFEKSGLFSMVVTPNLLEKSNYVMTTEYPMACEAGKTILPIAAVDIDKEALKQDYPGIPEPIEAQEGNVDLIGSLIRKALDIKKDDDPLHKFFIGLAYLSGIDMDTDHEKARTLITEAAEGECEEAYRKLVTMYEVGQGVNRDYEESASWQEKYVVLLEKKLSAEETDEDLRFKYIRAANAAAAKWRGLLRYDHCWSLLEKMMALEIADMSNHEKIAMAESFQYAAEMANSQKEYSKARKFLEMMLEISDSFITSFKEIELENKGSSRDSDMLKTIYRGLGLVIQGDIEANEKNWEEAISSYEEAEPLIRKVFARDPAKNQDSARTLVGLYGKLGEAYYVSDKASKECQQKAEKKCREGLLFMQGVRNQNGAYTQGPYAYRMYKTLIEIYKQEKNYIAAQKAANELLALAEKENEDQGSISSARILAFAYSCLGSIAEDKKDYAAAEKQIRAAAEIEKALTEKAGINETEKQLVSYYQNLLRYANERGDDKTAAFYSDNIRYFRSQLAMHYYRKAEKGDRQAAAKAHELYQKLHEDYPDRDYGKNAVYVKNHFLK